MSLSLSQYLILESIDLAYNYGSPIDMGYMHEYNFKSDQSIKYTVEFEKDHNDFNVNITQSEDNVQLTDYEISKIFSTICKIIRDFNNKQTKVDSYIIDFNGGEFEHKFSILLHILIKQFPDFKTIRKNYHIIELIKK